jgi:hypothetical protein
VVKFTPGPFIPPPREIKTLYPFNRVGWVAVKRLTTGWTVRGSNSGFGGLGVCMLASGTQDRGFAPDRTRRIFPAGKKSTACSTIRYKRQLKVQYQNNEAQDTNKLKTTRWGRDFSHTSRPALGPTQPPVASCTMGTGSFPGVKRPGRGADHPPPSSAEVENE